MALECRPMRPPRAPPPNQPPPTRPSSEEAKAVAAALVAPRPITPTDLEAVHACLRAWAWEVWSRSEYLKCAWCGDRRAELFQAEHATCCAVHPAYERLSMAGAAASVLTQQLELPPASPPVVAPSSVRLSSRRLGPSDFESVLAAIVGSPTGTWSELEARAAAERCVLEWLHWVDRTSEPCPWCGAIAPLESFSAHLMQCVAHPAFRAAAELSELVRPHVDPASFALLWSLAHEAFSARQWFSRARHAAATFRAALGWNGEAPYAHPVDEDRWEAVRHRVANVLAQETTRQLALDGSQPQPVRRLAHRLFEESRTARAGLKSLLRVFSRYVGGMSEDERGRLVSSRQLERSMDGWLRALPELPPSLFDDPVALQLPELD